jgi:uncharacterized protein YajQ (UPF0234 family)
MGGITMPSFDIVSNIDNHEMTNAVDQANREITTRFDFKDTNSRIELGKDKLTIIAPTDFQLKQVDEILRNKCAKRQVDIRSFTYKEVNTNLSEAKQEVDIKQGIDQENAKKITKLIKDSGLKVQAAIQGEQIRVTAKKRDDLQEVMAMLRKADTAIPLQYTNFRD